MLEQETLGNRFRVLRPSVVEARAAKSCSSQSNYLPQSPAEYLLEEVLPPTSSLRPIHTLVVVVTRYQSTPRDTHCSQHLHHRKRSLCLGEGVERPGGGSRRGPSSPAGDLPLSLPLYTLVICSDRNPSLPAARSCWSPSVCALLLMLP